MAVPPMIGVPEAGGYVFYSGSRELFERHQETLGVPAGATSTVGQDAGFAALHDVALLSATYGMFAGVAHAFRPDPQGGHRPRVAGHAARRPARRDGPGG